MPTAWNLNLYRGWQSCVGWHCDDEPLFSDGGVSPVRTMKYTSSRLAMVTFLSWMANVRMSSFIGRTLAGNRNGLILRSVGSNSMFPFVLCLRQGWHADCQRVRMVHQFLLWGMLFLVFFFSVSSWCFVHMENTSLAGLLCASCWTRPLGGGRWGHYLCNLQGENF